MNKKRKKVGLTFYYLFTAVRSFDQVKHFNFSGLRSSHPPFSSQHQHLKLRMRFHFAIFLISDPILLPPPRPLLSQRNFMYFIIFCLL